MKKKITISSSIINKRFRRKQRSKIKLKRSRKLRQLYSNVKKNSYLTKKKVDTKQKTEAQIMTTDKTEFKKIHINELELDRANPRLPKSLQYSTEEDIISYMLQEAATLELMIAIGKNDYFLGEQLLVVKGGNKYTVVEGNRRLTAVKLLNNKDLATVKKESIKKVWDESEYFPTRIPCLVFKEREDILKYLGYRHITGTKSWRLLEKARYLYSLKQTHYPQGVFYDACREIAKMIGSKKNYVERILIGYELYLVIENSSFYNIHGLNDTNFYFNYLSDSLNKINIRTFLGIDFNLDNPVEKLNRANLKKLSHWFFEKNSENRVRVLGDSNGLKKIDAVLGKDVALEAFENGSTLDFSFELTEGLSNQFQQHINKALKYLELADKNTHKLKVFYAGVDEDLKELGKLVKKIKLAKLEFDDDDDN